MIRKYPCKQIKLIYPNEGNYHEEDEPEEEMIEVAEDYIPSGEFRHYCISGQRIIWWLDLLYGYKLIYPPALLST